MDVVEFYLLGVALDLVWQTVALIFYLFDTFDRWTYEKNVNKVELSFDPIYGRFYSLADFKHSWIRFCWMTIFGYGGCLLSWVSVLYRARRVLKAREIKAILTPDNRRAFMLLRSDSSLSQEEVERLIVEAEPILGKRVRDSMEAHRIRSAKQEPEQT